MRTQRRWVLAGVSAALIGVVVVAGEVRRYRAKPSAPRLQSVVLCETAAIELIDLRCDRSGTCDRRSARLSWSRGEGALFVGEGEAETRTPLRPAELDRLRQVLTAVDALETDAMTPCSGGYWAGHWANCSPGASTQTITTACGSAASTETFGRVPPFRERLTRTSLWCEAAAGWDRTKCLADAVWRATFVTERADRVNRVLTELRDAARR